ncbi:hypothetical protein NSR39_004467 [Salmonella enterica]|nr:hypothetical protein [Salmonella enterica]EJF6002673.1 hypothetical protein [Salmonella enterica]EJF6030227.1 hypothetical protein [Salmonella enterica]EJF6191723.1 hypothetical protein [Salmonella enterica]EJW2075724.1 hypothetical protein [Salmonella enterica]
MRKLTLQGFFYILLCGEWVGWLFFFAAIFCKKNNININSFSGVMEMYRRVFAFENKIFSIVVIICVYGGALVGLFLFGITLWAEGRGCVFPMKYS